MLFMQCKGLNVFHNEGCCLIPDRPKKCMVHPAGLYVHHRSFYIDLCNYIVILQHGCLVH